MNRKCYVDLGIMLKRVDKWRGGECHSIKSVTGDITHTELKKNANLQVL